MNKVSLLVSLHYPIVSVGLAEQCAAWLRQYFAVELLERDWEAAAPVPKDALAFQIGRGRVLLTGKFSVPFARLRAN